LSLERYTSFPDGTTNRFPHGTVMNPSDTVVAISSATGAAARMIVRLAGPDAFAMTRTLTAADLPVSAATRTRLNVNGLPVPATLYAFRGPRSYTGDDLI